MSAASNRVVVRYRVAAERVEENEALIADVFKELRSVAPDLLHYTVLNVGEAGEFIHIFESEAFQLSELAAFSRFTEKIRERCVDLPQAEAFKRIGRYPA